MVNLNRVLNLVVGSYELTLLIHSQLPKHL